MIRIFKIACRYWYYYLVAAVSIVAFVGVDMYNPLVMRDIVDKVIQGGQYELFQGLILTLVGIIVIKIVLGYVRELAADYAGVHVTFDLRYELFCHLQKLSFKFYDGMNTGEVMSRIKEDADNIFRSFSFGFMLCMDQLLSFSLAIYFMVRLDWKLTLICLCIVPVIGTVALMFEKKISKVFEDISDETAELNTVAQESISGVRLVKAFARERYEIKKFLNKNQTYYELNNKQARTIGAFFPKLEFLTNMLIVILTLAGGTFAIRQESFSVGTLIAFAGYINMIIWPMRMLGWLTGMMAQCGASVKKIDKLFNEKPEIRNVKSCDSLSLAKGQVNFKNVSFSYRNEEEVVKGINFYAKPGQTIAIMGATGTGKSSIVQLLTRYYDATEGQVSFDGKDVKNVDFKQLRKKISVVMQDTFLFSDTIEKNIKLGNQDLSDEEMIEIAKKAQVHEFVSKMKEGYQTVIGERGIGLSGGQKQRISIARALATKPEVIIFDDATSALDMETESKIQEAIKKEKNMTTIVIAHRISAVKDADVILIIEDGEVIERGNHYQLLDQQGRYSEIYQHQYEGLLG